MIYENTIFQKIQKFFSNFCLTTKQNNYFFLNLDYLQNCIFFRQKRFFKQNNLPYLDLTKVTTFSHKNLQELELSTFFFSNNFRSKKNSNPVTQESNENLTSIEKKSQSRQNLRFSEPSKQQVVSITYEEIGLFPRSFNRVFDRFFKQLFFDVESLVIQEYRFYRYLFLTTVKCLFILIFVPLSVNFVAKNYLVYPITEYYWNTRQSEIFLNSYQQKRAYNELHAFEEKIYFESLIFPLSSSVNMSQKVDFEFLIKKENLAQNFSESNKFNTQDYSTEFEKNLKVEEKNQNETLKKSFFLFSNNFVDKTSINSGQIKFSFSRLGKQFDKSQTFHNLKFTTANLSNSQIEFQHQTSLTNSFNQLIQNRLQEKTIELAIHYNEESIEAITNFFADVMSFGTLCFLLFNLEIQINITKSFLLEVFFGLDDSKKSLLILFLTDLLVGYHSPNIWELFFQSLFDHYGLPESETTIFLLVATLPVLLDVLFKYLIFRHLNRASPATVATYHAMIE